MRKNRYSFLKGYMLLPPGPIPGYRGVDRHPFEPALVDEDILTQVQSSGGYVWTFYPPGWRQDAYRLYEENMVESDDLYLLSNIKAARKILEIIKPHLGPYEIIACEISELDFIPFKDETEVNFLGYDVAYPGGDLYSAIANGLFLNPSSILTIEYGSLLNEFGLFSTTEPIPTFVHRFKELVPSESNSEFCVFKLHLVMK